MSKKIGVLVIHGIGSQERGYSKDLIRELRNRLKGLANRFEWKEIYWASALKKREDELWDVMQEARDRKGNRLALDWTFARRFVIHNFGDASAYQRNGQWKNTAYDLVHGIISAEIKKLNGALADPTAPVVVMAHSLGAYMMSNYIWDRQRKKINDPLAPLPNLVAMITFGCNIPLFALSFETAAPIQLPGEGITKASLKDASKWLNYYDRDDVLGWPLKPLYANKKNFAKLTPQQQATVARIEDDEINVGGLVTSWNFGAHTEYWTDDDMTKPVTKYLKQLLGALDKP